MPKIAKTFIAAFLNVIDRFYAISDYFVLCRIFFIFLNYWFCYFMYDMFLSGYQRIETDGKDAERIIKVLIQHG